jgi:hypothetical protein
MAENGKKLFEHLACNNCHKEDNSGRGPSLASDSSASRCNSPTGGTVKADEAYFRESILQPQAKVVAGFEPVMPTFQGLVTEEGSCNWWSTSNRWSETGNRRPEPERTPAEINVNPRVATAAPSNR